MAQRDIPEGRSGILLVWDDQKINLVVCEWHDQYVHCMATCKISHRLLAITFVYGQLSIIGRKPLWEGLQRIAVDMELPWLVLCDFNTYLSADDKCGGIPIMLYRVQLLDFCVFCQFRGSDLHGV